MPIITRLSQCKQIREIVEGCTIHSSQVSWNCTFYSSFTVCENVDSVNCTYKSLLRCALQAAKCRRQSHPSSASSETPTSWILPTKCHGLDGQEASNVCQTATSERSPLHRGPAPSVLSQPGHAQRTAPHDQYHDNRRSPTPPQRYHWLEFLCMQNTSKQRLNTDIHSQSPITLTT